jgi:hypothetical protein
VPFWAPFSDAAEITSTTPFQPSRRRLGASSQPGNPLPNTLHHNVSARLDEAQLSHHSGVLRQMARKSDIASSVINLPELMQASGGGAAKACPGPHAFAHAGIVAVASTTVGAGTRARGRQRAISGVLLRLHLLRSESMSTSHFSLSLLSKLVGSLASYEANGWPFYFRTIPSKVLPPILLPKPPLLRLSERLSFFSSGIADDPKEDADDPR